MQWTTGNVIVYPWLALNSNLSLNALISLPSNVFFTQCAGAGRSGEKWGKGWLKMSCYLKRLISWVIFSAEKKRFFFFFLNLYSDDWSPPGFNWKRPFVSFTAVLSWSLLKLYLTSSRWEQTGSSAFRSFVRGNMSLTLSQLQEFLSARVNKSPEGSPCVCCSRAEL